MSDLPLLRSRRVTKKVVLSRECLFQSFNVVAAWPCGRIPANKIIVKYSVFVLIQVINLCILFLQTPVKKIKSRKTLPHCFKGKLTGILFVAMLPRGYTATTLELRNRHSLLSKLLSGRVTLFSFFCIFVIIARVIFLCCHPHNTE